MNIQKPDERFDFSVAISQLFRTQDGKAFAKRLWFWASAAYAIAMLVTFPFIIKHYPDLLEANWHNMKAMMAGRAHDNAALFAILPKMLPSYLFLMASMLAIGAAVETALHKKVLLGEEEQRMPLRFGSVQLRVLIAQVAVWMIWFSLHDWCASFGIVYWCFGNGSSNFGGNNWRGRIYSINVPVIVFAHSSCPRSCSQR